MKIKICGITDAYTANKVCEYGADYIGFVFAKSKRQISVKKAKEISTMLGSKIEKVGVFVDEKAEDIIKIADYCKLDYIQLHGSENLDDYKCDQKIIRSVSVDINGDSNLVKKFSMASSYCDHILFDTKIGMLAGGSGISFNWANLEGIDLENEKCFLAGGIKAENVIEAVKRVKPFAVDVSSGVETDGKKDIDKIKEFIELVRGV